MKRKKRLLLIVLALAGVFLAAVATWNLVQACSADGQFKKVGESQENGEHREGKEGEKVIHLSDKDMEGFGIGLETAGPGKLDVYSSFPAEIVVNWDRTAQIVPRSDRCGERSSEKPR